MLINVQNDYGKRCSIAAVYIIFFAQCYFQEEFTHQEKLTAACVENDVGYVAQWLADHPEDDCGVDWSALVSLACDCGHDDILQCLEESGKATSVSLVGTIFSQW